MSITLRRAHTDDVDRIGHPRDSMFREMGISEDVVAAASAPARDWLASALADGRYVGVLAHEKGAVVGGVGVLWLDLPPNMHTTVPRRGYLLNMYIEPSHRRRGLARRLIEESLAVCRASGVDSVSLHASDAGRPLYEALGFTATTEMRISLP
ncbi:MAG: GNAT family N-acetyltransferase [Dermatophilaceae bacterium]